MQRPSRAALVVSTCLFPFAPTDVLAQAPARFQQVIEAQVKPGQQGAFENYLKKLASAANQVGMKEYWSTFAVAVGKPGGTYRITLNFNTWGERDGWSVVPAVLAKAYGAEEGDRIFKDGVSAIERSDWQVWEYSPEGSSNAARAGAAPAALYQVTVRRIQPGMADAYSALEAKFKAAYEASASKPVVVRHVLRMGTGNNATFRRSQAFNTWAEMDAFVAPQLLGKHFGAETWARMANDLAKMLVEQEAFVSVYRPDLSRLPAAPSSQP